MNVLARSSAVDAHLPYWARLQPARPALIEGTETLHFAALDECVERRASDIGKSGAPRLLPVEAARSTAERLIEFLAIVRSGRCAAVLDASWSNSVRERVLTELNGVERSGRLQASNPFYLGFTSGSTGMPKGYLRTHNSWIESFHACVEAFGPPAHVAVLAPGSICHSLSLFGMLLGLWTGGGVVVQPRFSAHKALSSLESGEAACFIGVPSHLLMMLELSNRKGVRPISGVGLVMISGARWMRHRTPELRRLFPRARIVEFYGTSETSFVSWIDSDETTAPAVVGRPFPGVEIAIRPSEPGSKVGTIFVKSKMLFDGYALHDRDRTEAQQEGPWLSVGDMGHVDQHGVLHLFGRRNRMLVTSGKNLFPEEVEEVLESIPGVDAASLHARPDPLRGSSVVAVLSLSETFLDSIDSRSLAMHCRRQLEHYKVPREFYVASSWPTTRGGKTDHVALSRQFTTEPATAIAAGDAAARPPCLRRLP